MIRDWLDTVTINQKANKQQKDHCKSGENDKKEKIYSLLHRQYENMVERKRQRRLKRAPQADWQ